VSVVDADKLVQQRHLYGEPVGVLVRRITVALDLTQSAVSRVLGLSPAMLSQLMSGQRVKIGNPLALARLQALLALAEEAPRLTRPAVEQRLEEIRASRAQLTTSTALATTSDPGGLVRGVLRAVASGRELEQAAQALDAVSPALAEVLRVYGTGSDDDAARHLASVAHLLGR